MTSLDKNFEILELKPGASLDEIKRAYHDLAQVWHPDRYSHSSRLRRKAEERFKIINEAYQQLTSGTYDFGLGQSPSPRAHAREYGANSKSPTRPPPASEPRIPGKKRWGWTVLTVISLVLIRSFFNEIGRAHV